MSLRARKARVLLLDDRIDILDGNAAGSSPANELFRTVADILALVRGKMMANKDFVQLSDYCFNACEALKTTIEGRDPDHLDEYERVAVESLGRVTLEVQRTLRRGASMPHATYDKGKIEKYKSEIQDVLNRLNRQSPSPNGDNGVCERTTQLLSVGSSTATVTSASESGAFERLIRRKFVPPELPSLVEEVLMYMDVDATIRSLSREDAQTFIDVVNEALDMPDLSPWARNQCLRPLYRTCGRHALLPKTMEIPICYDRTGDALYSGGYADVWKGQYCGQDVAVKVIRTYSSSDLEKVIGKFCKEAITWKTLRHPNVLPLIGVTMTETKFAMISDWMANGNLNEFVKANPDADRLNLLGDTAKGLVYIHEWGIVHGDLKGANILIDQTFHARLADFGLLTVISDPANLLPSSSTAPGGTARWMSPERISPQDFGCKTSRPSKPSDCYSLGMVIYEIISGNVPFHEDRDLTVFVKVLKGERPHREVGFANSLWNMVEQCWMPQPSHRPNVEDVLRCLETCSNQTAGGMEGDPSFDSHISPPDEQGGYRSYDSNTTPVGPPSELMVNKNHSSPPTGGRDSPPARRDLSDGRRGIEKVREEAQASRNLNTVKQQLLHPKGTVPNIDRGYSGGNSNDSPDRGTGGSKLDGAPVSSRATPSPSHFALLPNMIGKSVWGPGWFPAANPRLGQSMAVGLPNDGSIYGGGALSPTPYPPFSINTFSHGVFDRYDLVPGSYPNEVSSEVAFGDTHSAFSDPDMYTTTNFRGFPHHSNYAGNSIFGTRSHQPQQHSEYGAGGTGLGLSGIQAPNPHSLQVPSARLQGIYDIVNAIRLQDHVPGSGYVSPHSDPIAATDASLSQHSSPPTTPVMSFRTARPTTTSPGNTAAPNRSLSVPPSENRPTISYHRQASDQSNLVGKVTGTLSSAQFHQLNRFAPPPGRDSNGHLNMPSIHAQPGTGTDGMLNSSSSLADALRPQSQDETEDLAFLDLHYGNHGGHHGMGAHSYGNSGTGTSAFGYTMERQGQAQALDLATNNSFANGYLPPATNNNATANQNQSRTIDPMLTQRVQQVPVQVSQVAQVSLNGTTPNVNVMSSFGPARQVSQPPPPPPPLPPVHEQMVGVERTGPARSASVQPTRGLGGVHSHNSFPTGPHHSHTHSRGLSAVVTPLHDLVVQKSLEGERGRKRASWQSERC